MLYQHLTHRNAGLFLTLALFISFLSTPFSIIDAHDNLPSTATVHPVIVHENNNTKALKFNLEQMPLYFIENRGQVDPQVVYYIEGKNKTLYFTSRGITFAMTETDPLVYDEPSLGEAKFSKFPFKLSSSRYVVKLDFLNANPNVQPIGYEQTKAVISYFKGQADNWKTSLSTYAKLVYPNLWPGIDLVYSGTINQLKYEFVVKPGADPNQIRLAYHGATSIKVNEVGQLEVSTVGGIFQDDTPYAYQTIDAQQVPVLVDYKLENKFSSNIQSYGFQVGSYDPTQPLILDPAILVYAGFIGGSSTDVGENITVDSAGNAYIIGYTHSSENTFPVTAGPDITYNGDNFSSDAFVAKVKADGTELIYAGYIGGTESELGYGIAVDNSGYAYVTGQTQSNQDSFPVTVGPDLTFNSSNSGVDVFVAKISTDGTTLVYAGYIGGDGGDHGYDIAIDNLGCAYITGDTTSDNFPVTIGPDLTLGSKDAFVAKVKSDGTGLIYAGYIGGSDGEIGEGIAVDNTGSAYITGLTYSDESTFPVTVGPDLTFNWGSSNQDAFVVKVKPDGMGFDYAGYIGGTDSDWGRGIAVDSIGNAYVTGLTYSDQATFPTLTGPDLTYNGGFGDAFIAKIKANGTGFDYAGYIGGTDRDWGEDIAVDNNGNTYVTGGTDSSQIQGFPVNSGPDLTHNGNRDAFVAKVKADGSKLLYSGFIGGSHNDFGNGITIDNGGSIYLTGGTQSNEITFPVRNGPGLTPNGFDDAFVVKIIEGQVYSITGQITDSSSPIFGVTVSTGTSGSTTTGASGLYTLTNLITGTYILTPSNNGYTFLPVTRTVNIPPDVTGQNFVGVENPPPSTITDLRSEPGVHAGEVLLTWTAPNDNGLIVSQYDFRYNNTPINESNWASATPISSLPGPGLPGSNQSKVLQGLATGTRWYFALKSANTANNWSDLSNMPSLQDTGFRPNPDGYEFENANWFSPDLTDQDMLRLFGEDAVCAIRSPICVFKWDAIMWQIKTTYTLMVKPRCDGMASTSLRFFKGLDRPYDFQNSALSTYELRQDNVRQHIAYYFAKELVNPIYSYRGQLRLTPSDVLTQLQSTFSGSVSDPVVLSIGKNEKLDESHSITPYALQDVDNGEWQVWVYDNNYPNDDDRYVSINTVNNTWSYDTGEHGEWSSNVNATIMTMIITPISKYAEPSICPWCSGGGSGALNSSPTSQIWLTGQGNLLINDSQGRQLGYFGNQIMDEIPGAYRTMIPARPGVKIEPIYTLPLSDTYTILLHGQDLSQSNTVSVTQFGPGYAVSVDNISLGPTSQDELAFVPDGTEITYSPNSSKEATLTLALDRTNQSDQFSFIGIDMGANQTTTLKADLNNSQVIFDNALNGGGEYNLTIDCITSAGQQGFAHDNIPVSATDTHYANYNASNCSSPVTLKIDRGSNGTIDETVMLTNQIQQGVYLPIIIK